MTCEDCQETGHANNKYYKCKFYKEISADDGNVLLYVAKQPSQTKYPLKLVHPRGKKEIKAQV
jgi:hypothetical protein